MGTIKVSPATVRETTVRVRTNLPPALEAEMLSFGILNLRILRKCIQKMHLTCITADVGTVVNEALEAGYWVSYQ